MKRGKNTRISVNGAQRKTDRDKKQRECSKVKSRPCEYLKVETKVGESRRRKRRKS